MTIDEAIKHAEEVVEENSKSYEEWLACKNRGNVGWSKSDIEAVDKSIEQCKKCAEEHRQLAEWLKDYKRLKEQQFCEDCISRQAVLDLVADYDLSMGQVVKGIHALPSVTPQTKPNIKALGEDIRICQKSITDKKVLIGFNMAVALCNKHLSESEVQDADSN